MNQLGSSLTLTEAAGNLTTGPAFGIGVGYSLSNGAADASKAIFVWRPIR